MPSGRRSVRAFAAPPDVYPLPDFRPWLPDATERLRADEDRVLADVNRLLESWNAAPLERLSRLYGQVDEGFLATFRELDHYPVRQRARYWGAWPNRGGEHPVWPGGAGKKVFAYLKPFRTLANLLGLLNRLAVPSVVYIDRLDPKLRNQHQSQTLRFADRPLDLAEVGHQCDLAILNAGHGATVSMLLAGKPTLQIPLNLEQTLTGIAVARLKAGLSVQPTNPNQFAASLGALLNSEDCCQGARRFAARYAHLDAEQQIQRIVDRIEELLLSGQRRTANLLGTSAVAKHEPSESLQPPSSSQPRKTVVPAARAADATPRILIGIGSGRCGTRSLAALLSSQPSTVVLHESRPLLPWHREHAQQAMRARFDAIIRTYPGVCWVGDVAHFYLPYVEEIIKAFPNTRIICMKRPREETVESYAQWIARTRRGANVDHWRADRQGLLSDPWDHCFPKYPVDNLRDGIRRFWDEYYNRVEQLLRELPRYMRVFDTTTLNDARSVRELLDWAGISHGDQNLTRVHLHRTHFGNPRRVVPR